MIFGNLFRLTFLSLNAHTNIIDWICTNISTDAFSRFNLTQNNGPLSTGFSKYTDCKSPSGTYSFDFVLIMLHYNTNDISAQKRFILKSGYTIHMFTKQKLIIFDVFRFDHSLLFQWTLCHRQKDAFFQRNTKIYLFHDSHTSLSF